MPFLDGSDISTPCNGHLALLATVSQASTPLRDYPVFSPFPPMSYLTNQDERAYLNSTKVPLFTGHSISLIYLKQKFTSFLYFSSPSHPMNVVLANRSPSR